MDRITLIDFIDWYYTNYQIPINKRNVDLFLEEYGKEKKDSSKVKVRPTKDIQ